MMSSDRIQHMRFDQIDERKAGANVVRELNDRPKKSRSRLGGILTTRNPRSQRRAWDRQVSRSFCQAIGGLLFGRFVLEFLFLQSHVT